MNIKKSIILTIVSISILSSLNANTKEIKDEDQEIKVIKKEFATQIDDIINKLNYKEDISLDVKKVKDPFEYPKLKTSKNADSVEKEVIVLPPKIIYEDKPVYYTINYQGFLINKVKINEKYYKQGDTYYNSKITKITPEYILLEKNNFVYKITKKTSKNINIK